MKNHLTIRQFSKLAGISSELLRHYDARKILQPDLRDDSTGYRYYRPGQVTTARQIMYLRDAGLGLEDIRALHRLENRKMTPRGRGFIRDFEAGLEAKLESILLTRQYLKSLRIGARGPFARIQLIQIPTMRAAVQTYSGQREDVVGAIASFCEELLAAGLKIAGDPVLTWQPERRAGSTIAVPVLGKTVDLPGTADATIAGGTVAAIDCKGTAKRLGDSYERLFSWCYESGFTVNGSLRESYPLEEWTTLARPGPDPRPGLRNIKTSPRPERRKPAGRIRVMAPVNLVAEI